MRPLLLATLLALLVAAPAAALPRQELLAIDVATGAVTRLGTPRYVRGSCWSAQRLEVLVSRPGGAVYATYRPGRPPRVVHRPPDDGKDLRGADYAPGCGRVAETYLLLPGDPRTGGVLVRERSGRELFRLAEGALVEADVPLAWSADGSRLAVAMHDPAAELPVLRVVDGATGALVRRHVPPDGIVVQTVVGFSPDGTTLTYQGLARIGTARRVLHLRTGADTPAPDPFADEGVLSSATSPDGSLRAFTTPGPGGASHGLAVVEQRPGAKPRTLLRRGPLQIGLLGWSPDGRGLAIVRHEPY